MLRDRSNAATRLGVAMIAILTLSRPSLAQDGPGRKAGPHGGVIEKTEHYQLEVLFARNGLKVYPYGKTGSPLDASRLTGTATFYHPSSPQPWFDRPLRAAAAAPGQPAASLDLRLDLSKVPAKGTRVTFVIDGLPAADEPKATFSVPIALRGPVAITVARATAADQAAINTQRVCKVSGEPLGSMGVPLKVARGDQSVLLCCQGCLRTVQADPDRFLGASTSAGTTKAK